MKRILSATALMMIALSSTNVTAFNLFGFELPTFEKTELTRVKGQPMTHQEPKLLMGKYIYIYGRADLRLANIISFNWHESNNEWV